MNKSRSFVGFARILFIQNKIQLTNAESNVYVNSMRNHKAYLSLIPTLTELWRVRMTTPFPTQLFNKFNNKKGADSSRNLRKICPKMVGERFISRPLGEKWLWHLFILHLKKWHEKTPEALRRLGFSDRHLFRSLNVAWVTNLDATPKCVKHQCFQGFSHFCNEKTSKRLRFLTFVFNFTCDQNRWQNPTQKLEFSSSFGSGFSN